MPGRSAFASASGAHLDLSERHRLLTRGSAVRRHQLARLGVVEADGEGVLAGLDRALEIERRGPEDPAAGLPGSGALAAASQAALVLLDRLTVAALQDRHDRVVSRDRPHRFPAQGHGEAAAGPDLAGLDGVA